MRPIKYSIVGTAIILNPIILARYPLLNGRNELGIKKKSNIQAKNINNNLSTFTNFILYLLLKSNAINVRNRSISFHAIKDLRK